MKQPALSTKCILRSGICLTTKKQQRHTTLERHTRILTLLVLDTNQGTAARPGHVLHSIGGPDTGESPTYLSPVLAGDWTAALKIPRCWKFPEYITSGA